MKQINSNKKVTTNSRTGEQSFVVFSNIRVTQNTAKDSVNVSMDIFKREDTEHIVVVNDTEETVVSSKFLKMETISDSYESQLVDNLVAATIGDKPADVEGFFATNNFLYVNIAKSIIANDSESYYGLTADDLEIV